MLLYEYPSKLEKAAERRQIALMAARRRKLGLRCLLTYACSIAIIAVGLTADETAPKIAICLLGCVIAVMCFVTSALMSSGLKQEHTVITDQGFSHETFGLFKGKKSFMIKFSDIEHTEQSPFGALVIRFKGGDTEVVPFKVTKTKLFLIKNLSEQLKYPIKEYNDIDDDSDRKDWVDRL